MAVTLIRRKKYEPKFVYEDKAVCDLESLFQLIDWRAVDAMIEGSTPVTHDLGNRRYKDYVFLVEDGRVHGVGYFNAGVWGVEAMDVCPACKNTGKVLVYDVCPVCDGDGCARCEEGLIENKIACQEPNCKTVKNRQPPALKKIWDSEREQKRRSYR